MSYSDALLTKSWYVENVWEHIYIEIAKKNDYFHVLQGFD